ncbi:5-formyltetrahydrofolate cyclo-ligase [Campylobacter helveticus]|uniref:5-formyltetrahydrofolate cyclo-ligase n=1 Tax=Campylobacter helveticus TaxID=28898 RepID=A0AAX2UJJ7_9BACT|nr:5-formyltetrahydrofolate cyclo-ligase [Campylobacter helveticus]MCR2039574.1 5-formyltetrahydrofolate cyclo-ligase [Campylobacter helveticus]MCR2054271.1 5-formyltetrahydrofolate cyclo-ligase [Campylobacter helveticus]MCR2056940.1 5-formyltetrahydrofolate cyclo-ligase [Campylobacter helveticus]MCR2062619.1 5-formyltetrahydrofolate cyclo-ligase [Campylobacter helveticus]MCR2064132.1 5-formyltetrahydrofolate cyclo-ligase [Campylobacter helveticus]
MQKELFRQVQKKRLKQNAKLHYKNDYFIFKECLRIIRFYKAKNVLIFLPLSYEPNLVRFRRILSQNCKLFVPFMQDKSLKIVKLRLPFFKKRFGVLEPNNSFFDTTLDVAFVPVIGIDKDMKRIGHGEGFYDRFFANLKHKPLVVFVQSITALSEKKITQEYDMSANFYLSPYRKYFKRDLKNDSINRIYRRFNRCGTWVFSR